MGFDTIMEAGVHRAWLNREGEKTTSRGMAFYERVSPLEPTLPVSGMPPICLIRFMTRNLRGFLCREAIKFMEENKDGRFLLWLSFNEPHAPFHYPVEYAGRYDPAEVPLPEGSPEDDRWVPEIFRGLTEDERRGIMAAYYTCVEYMDRNIGMVIDALDEMGIRENTLIVYVSDNGYLLNHHERFEKHTMWAESVKIPW
jgi:hypothetical protein